jgi:hypothetical protein
MVSMAFVQPVAALTGLSRHWLVSIHWPVWVLSVFFVLVVYLLPLLQRSQQPRLLR